MKEELNEDAMSYQTLYEQQLETTHRLKQNITELLSVDIEEELLKENEQLKQFIKSLASHDGKIWLSSGYGYRIDKILNDFNNTENDDGDVE